MTEYIDFFSPDASATILSVQLYVAGSESTSTSLRWVLLYMCLYPELQRRVHDEIDEQIGKSSLT